MKNKIDLKDISTEELQAELNLRQEADRQKKEAERLEALRIYNLPKNVAARKKEEEEQHYRCILARTLKLIKGVTEDTTGIWKIYGEDPNPDMGGYHHEPYLGKVEGKLKSVILYAIKQPKFFSWGGGGRIVKAEPKREKIKKLK